MKFKKDYCAIISMICMCVTSICGILSMRFNYGYDFVNQYGKTVKIFGYGIYANDSYFKAPIFIGTDFCILFVLIPMFLYTYIQYIKLNDTVSELKLISVYAVTLYYAASMAFGATYNQIFLIYVLLFSASLFGMFSHIKNTKIQKSAEGSKGLKAFLIISGLALFVAWLPDILSAMIKGETLSLIDVYTTEITYVIDMGIISPLCFVCIYLIKKRDMWGTIILASILKLCIIVGAMMITQTLCQMLSEVNIPFIALATKSLSFMVLAVVALFLNHKMYKEVN